MTPNFFVVLLPNVPILLLQTILSMEFCVHNSWFSETHNVQELIDCVKSPYRKSDLFKLRKHFVLFTCLGNQGG